MVLFMQYGVLAFESVVACSRLRDWESAIMKIKREQPPPFRASFTYASSPQCESLEQAKSVDELLRCYHSNETSALALSYSTICFQYFTKQNLKFLSFFDLDYFWQWNGKNDTGNKKRCIRTPHRKWKEQNRNLTASSWLAFVLLTFLLRRSIWSLKCWRFFWSSSCCWSTSFRRLSCFLEFFWFSPARLVSLSRSTSNSLTWCKNKTLYLSVTVFSTKY